MHFRVVGINHSTATVVVREKASFQNGQLSDALAELRIYTPNGVILSTCNRTEIYYWARVDDQGRAGIDFLQARSALPGAELQQHTYILNDGVALDHLFRVASGLDSMIIGEYEVLSQVKRALEAAENAGTVDLNLRNIFQSAIGAGRRVRDETDISKNAVSVSSIAVELASRSLPDFAECQMLVIGAGEAGRLVAQAAKESGVSKIVVASRHKESADSLVAELGGIPTSLSNLSEALSASQIAVTCAAAPHWLLDAEQVAVAMEQRPDTPLVIIDIGLPRNVEPSAGQVKNVFLYNIDDLTWISDRNRQQREKETQAASRIIAEEVDRFTSGWQALEARPLVSTLMQRAEDIRRAQFEKTVSKLHGLSDEERDRLEAMTRSIVSRILSEPLSRLKSSANPEYARMVSEVFDLEMESAVEENSHRVKG